MLPEPCQSMIQNMPTLCIVRPLRVTFAHWFIMIACAPVPRSCKSTDDLSDRWKHFYLLSRFIVHCWAIESDIAQWLGDS